MSCSQCNNKSVIVMPLGNDKRHLCQIHYEWYQRYAAEYFVKFDRASEI